MGSMVLSRRRWTHSVSFGERESASRTDGAVEGQSTSLGVYPFGEAGRARRRFDKAFGALRGTSGDTTVAERLAQAEFGRHS